MRNDDRIRAAADSADSLGDAVRDQGYSRARVLVLVPFKCSAVRIVNAILDACPGAAGDISGYDRFLEEFDIVDEVLRVPSCSVVMSHLAFCAAVEQRNSCFPADV
jgi:hypothetical protein